MNGYFARLAKRSARPRPTTRAPAAANGPAIPVDETIAEIAAAPRADAPATPAPTPVVLPPDAPIEPPAPTRPVAPSAPVQREPAETPLAARNTQAPRARVAAADASAGRQPDAAALSPRRGTAEPADRPAPAAPALRVEMAPPEATRDVRPSVPEPAPRPAIAAATEDRNETPADQVADEPDRHANAAHRSDTLVEPGEPASATPAVAEPAAPAKATPVDAVAPMRLEASPARAEPSPPAPAAPEPPEAAPRTPVDAGRSAADAERVTVSIGRISVNVHPEATPPAPQPTPRDRPRRRREAGTALARHYLRYSG